MDIAWLQLSFIFPLKLQLATDHVKQTKSKILDLAISGKLVPQDPDDEPAIELLSLFFVYSSAKNGPLHFSPLFTNTDQFMLNAKF